MAMRELEGHLDSVVSRPLYNRVESGRIQWTLRGREASSEDPPGRIGQSQTPLPR